MEYLLESQNVSGALPAMTRGPFDDILANLREHYRTRNLKFLCYESCEAFLAAMNAQTSGTAERWSRRQAINVLKNTGVVFLYNVWYANVYEVCKTIQNRQPGIAPLSNGPSWNPCGCDCFFNAVCLKEVNAIVRRQENEWLCDTSNGQRLPMHTLLKGAPRCTACRKFPDLTALRSLLGSLTHAQLQGKGVTQNTMKLLDEFALNLEHLVIIGARQLPFDTWLSNHPLVDLEVL